MKRSSICAVFAWCLAFGVAGATEAGALMTSYTVNAHVQDYGQLTYPAGQWVGTMGQGRRLEAFQIMPQTAPNGTWPSCLKLQYMAHVRGSGDTQWATAPDKIGTEGKGLQIEGVAFKAAGTCGNNYTVSYRCHLAGTGTSTVKYNGAFCGTRGQGRRLEAFTLNIRKK